MQIIFRVLDRLLTSVILVKSTMFFAIYHLGTVEASRRAAAAAARPAGRPVDLAAEWMVTTTAASSINLQETYFLCH